MFDIGATELLLVAVVMILVVGPKELPGMLRNIGLMVKKLRGMASDFQGQFDDALKEAELDGVKDTLKDVHKMNPINKIKDELNPINKVMAETKAELNDEVSAVNRAVEDKGESKSTVKKPPAKKLPAQKAPAQKASTKKPPAKKADVKKTSAKKAPAKKAPKKTEPKTKAAKKPAPKTGKSS